VRKITGRSDFCRSRRSSLHAVHARHLDVEDRKVRRRGAETVERRRTIRVGHDAIAFGFERDRDGSENVAVVIDQAIVKTRVFTELAWHSLFIRTLLIRPERDPRSPSFFRPSSPSSTCRASAPIPNATAALENVVAIDFARKIVLIGGSYYAGEMKKSVFTTLNYYLPAKGVMPMHCSANVGPTATPRSSSACPAPARPRCRPIPSAR
jgi:hypothetical protein